MRIALRTSGGRGEYELAGRQADVLNSDLFGLNLTYQVLPGLLIDGHSAAQMVQGKPRIRLDGTGTGKHAYLVLAALLLLPSPRRAPSEAAIGPDFVRDKQYVVSDVDVDVVSRSPSAAALRPTRLYLRNATGLVRSVEVAERMAEVNALWDAARGTDGALPSLIQDHEVAAYAGDHADIEAAAEALRVFLDDDGDVLPQLLVRLGVEEEAREDGYGDDAPADEADDDTEPGEARRREVAKWRKQAVRTAAGRKFAGEVRQLYGDRCAISGVRLPKLESTPSGGVDAAHILPWAKYDLNAVTNGLCLNKLCHWAFDAGVLRVDFDSNHQTYLVSIPDDVQAQAVPAKADLGYFAQFVGAIPDAHLPTDTALRPSPQYLARLNAEMYG